MRLGEIRITDKSGEDAVIDLRFATTIDDVLTAINSNTTINVTAEVVGDKIRLTDNTGQSGTLSVQEVNNGNTAADLGILGSLPLAERPSALEATSSRLHAGTRLAKLNDGNGVYFTNSTTAVDDLVFQLRRRIGTDRARPLGCGNAGRHCRKDQHSEDLDRQSDGSDCVQTAIAWN